MGVAELLRCSVAVAVLLIHPLTAAASPQRVVSMNVCADQLVMMLLPKERIASVSYLAVDPAISTMAEDAEGLHLNHGLAEEVLPLDPDLLVAGRYSARPTVNILKKLGYNVLDLAPESSLRGFRDNLRAVAEAVGEEGKAERIIADFDARLTLLTARRQDGKALVYANYAANGMTSGAGTLVADVVHHAGMTTLGETLGFSGNRRISLEQLVASRPDIIDADMGFNGQALANENFRHPAFRIANERALEVTIPVKYFACGTPRTLDALEALVKAAEARAS